MSANNSKALAYVLSKGWNHRITDTQIILEICPVTGCDNWHFYMSHETDKDSLWTCHKCGQSGNLYTLKEYLGDKTHNITSMRDVAQSQQAAQPLPDVEAAFRRLMTEGEDTNVDNPALEYLMQRGFTMEVIERFKLGVTKSHGKRWLVIPYFHCGKLIYAKFRTLPPDEKEFMGVSGRETPLFNQDCLTRDMGELIFVEGEGDALACISKGIEYVVGVPGANGKKSSWIDLIDKISPKSIYLLYDNDQVGQSAAKEMAKRIGIDKVKNIVLPEFTFVDENEEEHEGKDINEWFRAGHTVEEFEQLKSQASKFGVDGIRSVGDVISEIKQRLAEGGSLKPKWEASAWESFNRRLLGYEEGDLIGVLAPEKVGKTTFIANVLDFLNVRYDESVLLFCQEMMPDRLVQKWVSMVTDTRDEYITEEVVDSALRIAASRNADYLFGYTRHATKKEVFDTIRQAVRRYGVKFVAFDNLQILTRSSDHMAQEVCTIANDFKQLALELGIVIFLIMQPHAMKEGEIVSSRNVYGSSAPGKAVDAMVCLHRNREGNIKAEDFAAIGFLEVEESFSPDMLVRVDLNRFGSGGTTTLHFDGAKSKVTEFTRDMVEQRKNAVVDPTRHVQPSHFEAA